MAQGNNAQLIETMQQLTEAVRELTASQRAAAGVGAGAPAAQQRWLAPVANRNEIIVALINSHNPYTSNDVGDMSVFAGNPDPGNLAGNSINQIELEVDGPYSMPMEWNFKGSPQKINKTIRLKYRYLARNLELPTRPLVEPRHWVTAYLLIGYEDGGA